MVIKVGFSEKIDLSILNPDLFDDINSVGLRHESVK